MLAQLGAATPAMSDGFADAASGWETKIESDVNTAYVNGEFRIWMNGHQNGVWVANGPSFAGAAVSVDLRSAPSSVAHPAGLFVRMQDEGNYQGFVIGDDGSYLVFHLQNGHFAIDGAANNRLPEGIFRQGGANTVAAVAKGDTISYFVNGSKIVDAAALWPAGRAGLFAGNGGDGVAETLYDNWSVLELAH